MFRGSSVRLGSLSRRLKPPELMNDVRLGAVDKDEIVAEPTPEKVAPPHLVYTH